MLTKEVFGDTVAQTEANPTESPCQLSVQSGVSYSSAHSTTKLLYLQPYKITAIQHLFPLG
jgi:hypothetical protein